MSIKKLFDKGKTSQVVTSTDLQNLSEEIESPENLKQRFEDVNRFVPTVNFSDPENFARFGSAEKYYTDAMDRIVSYYPYDGSEAEQNDFRNESSYVDNYIFDNLYPRTTGYAKFSKWGDTDTSPAASNKYYGEPTAKEYIEIRGGPHTGSYGMPSGSIGLNFTGSNYYSTDIYAQAGESHVGRDGTRESNLRMNLDDGITIEFWLKKEQFIPSKTQKEVIFDLWNQVTASSHAHGRLRVELTASGRDVYGADPFRFTFVSGAIAGENNSAGADGQQGTGFQNVPLGGSTITTASVADNKWHHYALSVSRTGSNNTIRFYRDGQIVTTFATGSLVSAEITGSLIGFIGALQTHPNLARTPSDVPADKMVGWGKLSGSIDEFRYWKTRRTSEEIAKNWYTQVRGGTNTDLANTELGVYYKFNEGITGDSALDSIVLDYSGRISNGRWVGYNSDSRFTGSAIVEHSGSNEIEFKDPIIYPTHPDVQALRTNLVASASFHDTRNNSSIFQSLPSWMIEDDDEAGGQLKNLTQIIGNYFDTLYLQMEAIKDLHVPTYQTSSGKALPFANRLLDSKGFINSEIFANAEVLEAVMNRDTDREYSADLHNIKNLIYQNIYNNLVHIFKTKGTEKSFHNLIRSFGVDEELIRINLYADNTTHLLRDNFRPKAKRKNFVDFYQADNHDAVVTHDIRPSTDAVHAAKYPNAVMNTFISGSGRDINTTAEAEVIFPRLKDPGTPGYVELTFTDSSIFGWDQARSRYQYTVMAANAGTPKNYVRPSNGFGYQILAVRPDQDSKDASFHLIDRSTDTTVATSSLFKDVYDDNRWVFALRTRNAITSSIAPGSPNTSHGFAPFGSAGTAGPQRVILTVADGTAASGMTERENVAITSAGGRRVTYLITDANEDGATTTGTELEIGSDTGTGTATSGDVSPNGCAVSIDLTGTPVTQNAFLVQLKAAIESAAGHNGEILVSDVPAAAAGPQSIVLTQRVQPHVRNIIVNSNLISQLSDVSTFTRSGEGVGTSDRALGFASATITVADGDAASGMTEKEHITLTDIQGTTKRFVITDANSDGSTATGTVLSDSSNTDTGAGTAGADEDGGIAVSIDLTGTPDTQNTFLVQLKAAIEGASSFGVECGEILSAADGAQSLVITQTTQGAGGNTAISTNISQLTVPAAFTGGREGFVEVSLYGVHTAYDRIQEEFALSASVPSERLRATSNFPTGRFTHPRRYYVGARRTNVTGGTINERSSVKVGYLRHWQMYLDNHVIQAHARDTENYGTFNPMRSSYLLANELTGTHLPEIETLVLNWDFSNVTGSDADGEFVLHDFSSGSFAKRRYTGDISAIVNNQYQARGHFFKTNTTAAVDTNYISSARYRLPESLTSYDMIDIRTQDDLTFTKETRPIKHFFAFEKSLYQTISEEMINMFAGINEFNNLIGEPANRYRREYKDMSKLRQLFYENVENTPDLDKYLSYYKWLDTALGEMLQQLVPASSRFSDDVRNMVEDTVLNRSKYRHILPTLRTPKTEIEGQIKGIEELLYNWKVGHAPMNDKGLKVVHPQPQDQNCLWWRQRAERMGATLTAHRTQFTSLHKSKARSTDYGTGTINPTGFTTGTDKVSITVPESMGGAGSAVSIALSNDTDGSGKGASGVIGIGTSGANAATVAAAIVDAINGVANSRVDFGSGTSANGIVGVKADNPARSIPNSTATINTSGYDKNTDKVSITVPVSMGGTGTAISIALSDDADGSGTGATDVIGIGAGLNETADIVADAIVDAINGVANSRVDFGNALSTIDGIAGVTASKPQPDSTEIRLEASIRGIDGNDIAVANVAGNMANAGNLTTTSINLEASRTGIGGNDIAVANVAGDMASAGNLSGGADIVPIMDEQREAYKRKGYSFISASVPQLTSLRDTPGVTKVGINNIPIYTGSYYPNNRFSRVYRLFVGTGFTSLSVIGAWNGTLIAGHNPTTGPNTKYTFWRTSTDPVDSTRLIEVSNIIDQTGCEFKNSFIVLPPKFPDKSLIFGGKKKIEATTTSSPASKARDLPFSLYISDALTGYKSSIAHVNVRLSDGTTSLGKLELNNMHQDINETREDSMQGPFVRKHVGGFPHRHVDLNTSKSTNAVSATATITVIDSSSPPGVPFIGEGDTIQLVATDGTIVTLTMQGTGGSTTSSETSGATLTAKTLSAGSYASSTLHATAQAVEIRTAINHHTKFSATNTANVITIVQADGGPTGNTTITITELGATGMSKTNFVGGHSLDRPTNRVEGFKLSFTADSISVRAPSAASDNRGSNNPEVRGDFYRNVGTRRPVNIGNVRQLTGSHKLNHIGNFTSFREIIHVSDRDANNRAFVKHEGKGPFHENSRNRRILHGSDANNPFGKLGEFKDVAKPNYYISGSSHKENDIISLGSNQFAESNRTDYIIIERFSAPGGPETAGDSMGGAALDFGSGQYSPYNSINYRNLSVRLALRKLLTDHTAQFGYRSDERHRATPIYSPSKATLAGFSGQNALATATITVADGDAASGMTEGEKITITSSGGTTRVYRVCDDTLTTVTTGTKLAAGSDTGAGTTADDGDIAVVFNIATSAATQNAFLVQLKAAIESNNGHNGSITVSAVPTEANGPQTITLTQAIAGSEGNTTITTDISQITVVGFTDGAATIPSFHKVNRNSRLRFELSGSRTVADTVIRKKMNDNFFVQREIPSTTTRYAWITGSLTHLPGHQTTILGHPDHDGMVSSSVSFDYGLAQGANTAIAGTLKSVGPGDIPALNFVSSSDAVSRMSSAGRIFLGPGGNVSHATANGLDKRSANSAAPNGFLPINFVGMNSNVRQVINTGSLILSGAGPRFAGDYGLDVGEVHADHFRIGTAPFYKATDLYLNTGDTAPFLSASSEANRGDVGVLNAINLNRNGPYGYPSFKQIRTGETRIGRYLRRNNIISFNETPGRHLVTEDSGRGRLEIIERFGGLKKFREPPATSRYKPVEITLGFEDTYMEEGVEVTATRPVSMLATYGNEMGFFGNVDLDIAKGRQKLKPVGYQTLTDTYLRGGLESPSTPIESFIEFKYTDTVYPRERNTYTGRARGRTGFQNNFWRDNRANRLLKGRFKIKFNGSSVLDAEAFSSPGGLFLKQTKLSSWNLDAVPVEQFVSGTVGVFNVLTGSEAGLLQHRSAMIHYGNKTSMSASVIYARPQMLEATGSVRSLTGPAAPSSSTSMILAGKPFGRMKIFGGMTSWEAGKHAGIIEADNTRPDKTYEFKETPATPFYDSYEDYSEDLRVIAQDYAIVPEFRISEHIEFYIKGEDGNFLAPNPRLLSIVHAERDLTKPDVNVTNSGRKLQNPYIKSDSDITDLNFFTIYSNTDFMKHIAEIREEHSELVSPTEITLTCKAAMKFLPYDGFYPAERTVEIATQFSKSFADNVSFTGDDKDLYHARMRPLITPLFSPGIMFNTIKSGMAVDYPVYTGPYKVHNPLDAGSNVATNYMMLSTASSPRLDDNGKIAGWDFRIPFEAMVEPEKYLTNLTLVDMEPHPSASMQLTASWNGRGDRLYKMMADNFFAAVPEFFLPNGEFSTLKSKPQKQFRSLDTGSIYGMRIKLRKSYNRGRQPDRISSYIVPQDTYNDANSTTAGIPSLRETFTMYSRPSAFGPPMSGREGIGSSGSVAASTYEKNTFGRQHITDSLLGLNPSFTPPYYDGEAWVDVLFRPSSSFATLGDILGGSKKIYWRFDNLALDCNSNRKPYGNLNINKFAMQLTASFNLFQKVQEATVTFDANGRPLQVGESEDDKSVWVMQPKFETPMFNFNDQFGINPIVAGTNLTVPVSNSESIARGIWHQFGAFPTDPQQGIFLEIEPIPDNFIKNRVPLYVSGSPGRFTSQAEEHHPTSMLNEASYDDTNYAGFYGGYNNVAASSSVPVLSLLDVVQFDKKSMKIGQIANKLRASEAVVAVPFIEEAGERKFFKVSKDLVNLAIDEPDTEEVGESIKHMIRSLDKYVLPPTMDFVAFRDEIDPIAMYFFEFEFEFDKNDLAHMWQNLMPPSGKIVKKAEAKVGHKLLLNELLGEAARETDNPIEDRIKWMVFKVKQRANMSYFSKVAGANADADDRYRFEFKAGRASEETEKQSRFGFNWPFDFFSMVELIKLESEIKFNAIDESIDKELVTSSEQDLVKGGITPNGQGPSSN